MYCIKTQRESKETKYKTRALLAKGTVVLRFQRKLEEPCRLVKSLNLILRAVISY